MHDDLVLQALVDKSLTDGSPGLFGDLVQQDEARGIVVLPAARPAVVPAGSRSSGLSSSGTADGQQADALAHEPVGLTALT